jgi:3-hydroxyisobutyrate dehydrogenase-like beta-hydroxyacid dehydrogenase
MSRVAVVGLGAMGGRIARRLLARRHEPRQSAVWPYVSFADSIVTPEAAN